LKKDFGNVDFCVTVDVEDSNPEYILNIKKICKKHNANVTWFVYPAKCNQPETLDTLAAFVKEGDEVGLHIHWPRSSLSKLYNMAPDKIIKELQLSQNLLASRFDLKSFRGGGLCQETCVLPILEQQGFEFDSSVAYKLNESAIWHQGHDHIFPVSGYYPIAKAYDVIAYDDKQRSTILEIPVTRGVPSPNFWCNMLEPGVTPLPIMKLIFTQYFERRRFQPLGLLVLILHSWSQTKSPDTLKDLDKFLDYANNHGVQFTTIKQCGHQWKKIWDSSPELRNDLLSYRFNSDTKASFKAETLKILLTAYNFKSNPVYYIKSVFKM
jgi:peptidoglycan/xylan/chitin deacetylase (PgdA/CDA1 family)